LAVLKNEVTVEAGKTNMFQRQKRLAVDVATSDNSAAFKKFAVENLGMSSMKCAAHLTGTNKIYFMRIFTDQYVNTRSYRKREENSRKEICGQDQLRQILQIPNTVKSLPIREFM
jgi:hypothetical protein